MDNNFISFNPRGFLEAIESTVANTFDRKIADVKALKQKTYSDKTWLTEEETAEYLGLKKGTLQEKRREGLIEAKKKEKNYYYHIDAIHAYIESDD